MKRVLVLSLLLACSKKGADMEATKADRGRNEGSMIGGGEPTTTAPGNTGQGSGSGFGDGRKGGLGISLDLDGAIEVGAGIDKDIVRKVVKDNTTKLQYCYEKTLLGNPGIEGKVVATFTIGADGSVGEVKAAGVHPDVEACVADAVKAFKFPPSAAKVEVSYPFSFKPA